MEPLKPVYDITVLVKNVQLNHFIICWSSQKAYDYIGLNVMDYICLEDKESLFLYLAEPKGRIEVYFNECYTVIDILKLILKFEGKVLIDPQYEGILKNGDTG